MKVDIKSYVVYLFVMNLVIFLTTVVAYADSLPKDVIQLVSNTSPYVGVMCNKDTECKDFTIDCAYRIKVNKGDKYNGILDKYKLGISYVYYNKYQNKYREQSQSVVVINSHGSWTMQPPTDEDTMYNICEYGLSGSVKVNMKPTKFVKQKFGKRSRNE